MPWPEEVALEMWSAPQQRTAALSACRRGPGLRRARAELQQDAVCFMLQLERQEFGEICALPCGALS